MPRPRQASKFELHRERWQNCRDCSLCERRNHRDNGRGGEIGVVLGRGQLPCDAFFVGEAPGRSENVLGKAFAGPAGKLLDSMVEYAITASGKQVRCFFGNLVCCLPLDDDGKKLSEPDYESVMACADRFRESVEIANPHLMVCCGALATSWVPVLLDQPGDNLLKIVSILHPAALLRMNEAQRGMAHERCLVTLTDAFESLNLDAPRMRLRLPKASSNFDVDDIPF